MQTFFSVMVDDAGVHRVGMQVDSAVELVLRLIQVHHASPWDGGETILPVDYFFRFDD